MTHRFLCPLVTIGCVSFLTSCQTIHFYSQAVKGQAELFLKRRPIERILADPSTSSSLRESLTSIQSLCSFAKEELSLPVEKNYSRYVDLQREHLVWVLYASPEFSLKGKTWWYPIVGSLKYQGYFNEAAAQHYATKLKKQGYDVQVGGVNAYSTLGWFSDPVLSTFVKYSEYDLAELLFHELTHRRHFRPGETAFNEALATTVSQEGVRRWLQKQNRLDDLKKYEARIIRRRQFFEQINFTRTELEKLYANPILSDAKKRTQKAAIFANLQSQLRTLNHQWGGRSLENWLTKDINNAHIISVLTYHEKNPEFEQRLASFHGNLAAFFRELDQEKAHPPN